MHPHADGIAISNRAIVFNALKHIHKISADVYIQICGQAHVLGDKDKQYEHMDLDYADSLTALFQAEGVCVLPLLLKYNPGDSFVPKDAVHMLSQSVKIQNMASHHKSLYHALKCVRDRSGFDFL